jgi:hypothetical protein
VSEIELSKDLNNLKMMKRIFVLFVLVFIVFPAEVFSGSNVGTTTGIFLKMPPGARPSGMGGAFTGISDDVNAMYWNPAGLVQSKSMEATATYIEWVEEISNTYIGFVYPFGKNALGFGVNYLSVGGIELRDSSGDIDTSADSSVYDMALALAYSRKIMSNLSIGVTGKQITQKLGPYQGNSMAFDIGGIYNIIEESLSVGVSVLNFASGVVIEGANNDLPMIIKIGAGYKPISSLILGFDVNQPNDNDLQVHVGAELSFKDTFAIRAGYDGGVTLGFGIKSPIKTGSEWGDEDGEELFMFEIDYAAVQVGDMETDNDGHRISINLKFK